MIDFIKIYFSDKSKFEPFVFKEENFENLYRTLEMHTGEISFPARTKLNTLDVVVSAKSGYVKNSLHKLYNELKSGEDHNHNDFTYSMLCETIDYLSKKVIDIEITGITQLEFGLNINTNKPAEKIIKRNILMHKGKGYSHNRKYYGKGELKQFDHHNYFIKVYDKAKQYDLRQNILRFELKFMKRREFQSLGIYNLHDLKDKYKLRKLFILLLKRFDEMTIIDSISDSSIFEEMDLNKLNKYKNPSFWEEKKETVSRTTMVNRKKDFEQILVKYSLLNTKTSLRNLLVKKFIYLINN